MITYQDGMEMRVGDSVLIEDGRTPGTISELIESAADQKQWNVDEPGVMIKSPPFGLVFFPVSTLADIRLRLWRAIKSNFVRIFLSDLVGLQHDSKGVNSGLTKFDHKRNPALRRQVMCGVWRRGSHADQSPYHE